MEITELAFRFRKNIRDFIELGVDVPFLSFNSGFMDGFINSYHNTFGFPDFGGRYSSGNNSLEFSFTEDPNTAGAPDFTVTFSFKRRF